MFQAILPDILKKLKSRRQGFARSEIGSLSSAVFTRPPSSFRMRKFSYTIEEGTHRNERIRI